jgi:hypothetical protein
MACALYALGAGGCGGAATGFELAEGIGELVGKVRAAVTPTQPAGPSNVVPACHSSQVKLLPRKTPIDPKTPAYTSAVYTMH